MPEIHDLGKVIHMIEKTKWYPRTRFTPAVIRKALNELCLLGGQVKMGSCRVQVRNERFRFDNLEECLDMYQGGAPTMSIKCRSRDGSALQLSYSKSTFTVKARLEKREQLSKMFSVFEENAEQCRLPKSELRTALRENIKVFIGHGHSKAWQDLLNHLQNQQGFAVVAYESGARAGYTISEVLKDMSRQASIAFLVHTSEDVTSDGEGHARENVIHETGLFQGVLGFKRAIVLLEEGCHEYGDLSGMQQLRFSHDNIREVFGDVVAVIYREFGME
jgi:predicted nucleotide-binding protein